MTLTVLSAASATELTDLETVKRELSSTGIANDKLLWDMIHRASDAIVTYTGRTFAREQVREDLPGDNRFNLILERTPVISIDAITFNGSTVSSTTFVVQDPVAGILFRPQRWTQSHLWNYNIVPQLSGYGRELWSITYTAGYITPTNNETERTLPYDIEHAALDIITQTYQTLGQNPNIASQRTGDASESYFQSSTPGISVQFPPSVRDSLSRWRRNDP